MRPRPAFTLIELLVVVSIVALLIALLLPGLNRARSTAQTAVCMSNQRQLANCFAMYSQSNNEYYPAASVATDPSVGEVISYDDLLSDYDGRMLNFAAKATRWLRSGNANYNKGLPQLYRCPSENLWPFGVPTDAYCRTYSIVTAGRSGGVYRGIGGISNPVGAPITPAVRTGGIKAPAMTLEVAEVRRLGAPQYMGYWCSVSNPDDQASAAPPLHDTGAKWNYLFCDSHVETLTGLATVGQGTTGPASNEQAAKGMWTRDAND